MPASASKYFGLYVAEDLISTASTALRPRWTRRSISFLLPSRQKISKDLTTSGRKISTVTVGGYIDVPRASHLLYEAPRYDIQGRGCLDALEKYYLGDLGLRYWLLGRDQGDVGHRVEDAVYLELRRRYRDVSVSVLRKGEIVFVVQSDGTVSLAWKAR